MNWFESFFCLIIASNVALQIPSANQEKFYNRKYHKIFTEIILTLEQTVIEQQCIKGHKIHSANPCNFAKTRTCHLQNNSFQIQSNQQQNHKEDRLKVV